MRAGGGLLAVLLLSPLLALATPPGDAAHAPPTHAAPLRVDGQDELNASGAAGSGTLEDPWRWDHLRIDAGAGTAVTLANLPGHVLLSDAQLAGATLVHAVNLSTLTLVRVGGAAQGSAVVAENVSLLVDGLDVTASTVAVQLRDASMRVGADGARLTFSDAGIDARDAVLAGSGTIELEAPAQGAGVGLRLAASGPATSTSALSVAMRGGGAVVEATRESDVLLSRLEATDVASLGSIDGGGFHLSGTAATPAILRAEGVGAGLRASGGALISLRHARASLADTAPAIEAREATVVLNATVIEHSLGSPDGTPSLDVRDGTLVLLDGTLVRNASIGVRVSGTGVREELQVVRRGDASVIEDSRIEARTRGIDLVGAAAFIRDTQLAPATRVPLEHGLLARDGSAFYLDAELGGAREADVLWEADGRLPFVKLFAPAEEGGTRPAITGRVETVVVRNASAALGFAIRGATIDSLRLDHASAILDEADVGTLAFTARPTDAPPDLTLQASRVGALELEHASDRVAMVDADVSRARVSDALGDGPIFWQSRLGTAGEGAALEVVGGGARVVRSTVGAPLVAREGARLDVQESTFLPGSSVLYDGAGGRLAWNTNLTRVEARGPAAEPVVVSDNVFAPGGAVAWHDTIGEISRNTFPPGAATPSLDIGAGSSAPPHTPAIVGNDFAASPAILFRQGAQMQLDAGRAYENGTRVFGNVFRDTSAPLVLDRHGAYDEAAGGHEEPLGVDLTGNTVTAPLRVHCHHRDGEDGESIFDQRHACTRGHETDASRDLPTHRFPGGWDQPGRALDVQSIAELREEGAIGSGTRQDPWRWENLTFENPEGIAVRLANLSGHVRLANLTIAGQFALRADNVKHLEIVDVKVSAGVSGIITDDVRQLYVNRTQVYASERAYWIMRGDLDMLASGASGARVGLTVDNVKGRIDLSRFDVHEDGVLARSSRLWIESVIVAACRGRGIVLEGGYPTLVANHVTCGHTGIQVNWTQDARIEHNRVENARTGIALVQVGETTLRHDTVTGATLAAVNVTRGVVDIGSFEGTSSGDGIVGDGAEIHLSGVRLRVSQGDGVRVHAGTLDARATTIEGGVVGFRLNHSDARFEGYTTERASKVTGAEVGLESTGSTLRGGAMLQVERLRGEAVGARLHGTVTRPSGDDAWAGIEVSHARVGLNVTGGSDVNMTLLRLFHVQRAAVVEEKSRLVNSGAYLEDVDWGFLVRDGAALLLETWGDEQRWRTFRTQAIPFVQVEKAHASLAGVIISYDDATDLDKHSAAAPAILARESTLQLSDMIVEGPVPSAVRIEGLPEPVGKTPPQASWIVRSTLGSQRGPALTMVDAAVRIVGGRIDGIDAQGGGFLASNGTWIEGDVTWVAPTFLPDSTLFPPDGKGGNGGATGLFKATVHGDVFIWNASEELRFFLRDVGGSAWVKLYNTETHVKNLTGSIRSEWEHGTPRAFTVVDMRGSVHLVGHGPETLLRNVTDARGASVNVTGGHAPGPFVDRSHLNRLDVYQGTARVARSDTRIFVREAHVVAVGINGTVVFNASSGVVALSDVGRARVEGTGREKVELLQNNLSVVNWRNAEGFIQRNDILFAEVGDAFHRGGKVPAIVGNHFRYHTAALDIAAAQDPYNEQPLISGNVFQHIGDERHPEPIRARHGFYDSQTRHHEEPTGPLLAGNDFGAPLVHCHYWYREKIVRYKDPVTDEWRSYVDYDKVLDTSFACTAEDDKSYERGRPYLGTHHFSTGGGAFGDAGATATREDFVERGACPLEAALCALVQARSTTTPEYDLAFAAERTPSDECRGYALTTPSLRPTPSGYFEVEVVADLDLIVVGPWEGRLCDKVQDIRLEFFDNETAIHNATGADLPVRFSYKPQSGNLTFRASFRSSVAGYEDQRLEVRHNLTGAQSAIGWITLPSGAALEQAQVEGIVADLRDILSPEQLDAVLIGLAAALGTSVVVLQGGGRKDDEGGEGGAAAGDDGPSPGGATPPAPAISFQDFDRAVLDKLGPEARRLDGMSEAEGVALLSKREHILTTSKAFADRLGEMHELPDADRNALAKEMFAKIGDYSRIWTTRPAAEQAWGQKLLAENPAYGAINEDGEMLIDVMLREHQEQGGSNWRNTGKTPMPKDFLEVFDEHLETGRQVELDRQATLTAMNDAESLRGLMDPKYDWADQQVGLTPFMRAALDEARGHAAADEANSAWSLYGKPIKTGVEGGLAVAGVAALAVTGVGASGAVAEGVLLVGKGAGFVDLVVTWGGVAHDAKGAIDASGDVAAAKNLAGMTGAGAIGDAEAGYQGAVKKLSDTAFDAFVGEYAGVGIGKVVEDVAPQVKSLWKSTPAPDVPTGLAKPDAPGARPDAEPVHLKDPSTPKAPDAPDVKQVRPTDPAGPKAPDAPTLRPPAAPGAQMPPARPPTEVAPMRPELDAAPLPPRTLPPLPQPAPLAPGASLRPLPGDVDLPASALRPPPAPGAPPSPPPARPPAAEWDDPAMKDVFGHAPPPAAPPRPAPDASAQPNAAPRPAPEPAPSAPRTEPAPRGTPQRLDPEDLTPTRTFSAEEMAAVRRAAEGPQGRAKPEEFDRLEFAEDVARRNAETAPTVRLDPDATLRPDDITVRGRPEEFADTVRTDDFDRLDIPAAARDTPENRAAREAEEFDRLGWEPDAATDPRPRPPSDPEFDRLDIPEAARRPDDFDRLDFADDVARRNAETAPTLRLDPDATLRPEDITVRGRPEEFADTVRGRVQDPEDLTATTRLPAKPDPDATLRPDDITVRGRPEEFADTVRGRVQDPEDLTPTTRLPANPDPDATLRADDITVRGRPEEFADTVRGRVQDPEDLTPTTRLPANPDPDATLRTDDITVRGRPEEFADTVRGRPEHFADTVRTDPAGRPDPDATLRPGDATVRGRPEQFAETLREDGSTFRTAKTEAVAEDGDAMLDRMRRQYARTEEFELEIVLDDYADAMRAARDAGVSPEIRDRIDSIGDADDPKALIGRAMLADAARNARAAGVPDEHVLGVMQHGPGADAHPRIAEVNDPARRAAYAIEEQALRAQGVDTRPQASAVGDVREASSLYARAKAGELTPAEMQALRERPDLYERHARTARLTDEGWQRTLRPDHVQEIRDVLDQGAPNARAAAEAPTRAEVPSDARPSQPDARPDGAARSPLPDLARGGATPEARAELARERLLAEAPTPEARAAMEAHVRRIDEVVAEHSQGDPDLDAARRLHLIDEARLRQAGLDPHFEETFEGERIVARVQEAAHRARRDGLSASDVEYLVGRLRQDKAFLDGLPLKGRLSEDGQWMPAATPEQVDDLKAALRARGIDPTAPPAPPPDPNVAETVDGPIQPKAKADLPPREAAPRVPRPDPDATPYELWRADAEARLREQGYDPDFEKTEEGIDEAWETAARILRARQGTFTQADAEAIQRHLETDADYFENLQRRGSIVDGDWFPLASAEEAKLLQEAMRAPIAAAAAAPDARPPPDAPREPAARATLQREAQLRAQGHDVDALKSAEARLEAARAGRTLLHAVQRSLSEEDVAFLDAKLQEDPRWLERLARSGEVVDGKWKPIAHPDEIARLRDTVIALRREGKL